MTRKTKSKKRGRKKIEMIRKSEFLKLENLLEESNQLVDSLRNSAKKEFEYSQDRINYMENNLANAYDEQQRLITVISSLGKTIQNLERVIKNRNLNFNLLQSETTTQLTPRN